MRKILFVLALLLVSCGGEASQYEIKIEYCDDRAAETVVVHSFTTPNHRDISPWTHSVKYGSQEYFNVCNVFTLRKMPNVNTKSYR